jgi:hypothetical protein
MKAPPRLERRIWDGRRDRAGISAMHRNALHGGGRDHGDNVPAGEDRILWIRLDMPITAHTTDSQALNIENTAQAPEERISLCLLRFF